MGIESWIDNIADLFAISNGRGGTVRSYRMYTKNEFPEAVSDFPSAITYPLDVVSHISAGASWEVWNGVTEFHLYPDISRANYPDLLLYFARIRNAAASDIKLGGSVSWFELREEDGPSMRGPVILRYGEEAPHLGIIVHWQVKENVTVTVA